MGQVIPFRPREYVARSFTSDWENTQFKTSGTIDGHIDLATPASGTYPLTLHEARSLVEALNRAIEDVEQNCKFDADPRLVDR